MSDPFVGQLALFPYNRIPRGWALCNGALLSISANSTLFSLLGVQFGGNGTSNFALPDLRGRVPNGQGQGPGLSPYTIGQKAGCPGVTLTSPQMGGHTHGVPAMAVTATTANPSSAPLAQPVIPGRVPTPVNLYTNTGTAMTLAPQAIAPNAGGQPHNNQQPTLVLEWCISLTGLYPSRN